jgi:hypothetical protein
MISFNRVLAVGSLVAFAGCSGNGTSTGGSVVCPALSYVATLISPASGAVNVSSTIGQIEVGNIAAGAQFVVTLTPTSGTAISQTSTASSAADGKGSTLAAPSLFSHTTYTVSLSDIGTCHSLSTAPIGSFTTQ